MVAENSIENDEKIIDLTELIEKGAAQPETAALATEKAHEEINEHMQSLNDGATLKDEADIDALLAQIDTGGSQPQAASPAQPNKVDPHEELDMSGMGEVDKLLDTLDMPQQPQGDPKDVDPAGMDDAVDQLLNAIGGPKNESGAETDVHDLLAAATPQGEQPGFSSDLDALLADLDEEQAPSEKKAAPAEAAAQENPEMDMDLDALLASIGAPDQEDAPAPQPAPAPAKAAPEAAQEADMDLDALLADLDGEQTPSEKKAAPAKAAAQENPEADMDLDALLASIGAPDQEDAPAPQPTPAPAKAAPEAAQEADMDLDALLANLDGEQTTSEKKAAPAEAAAQENPEADMDLDALLASIGAPDQEDAPAPQPAPAPAAAAPEAAQNADMDLDALLANMDGEQATSEEPQIADLEALEQPAPEADATVPLTDAGTEDAPEDVVLPDLPDLAGVEHMPEMAEEEPAASQPVGLAEEDLIENLTVADTVAQNMPPEEADQQLFTPLPDDLLLMPQADAPDTGATASAELTALAEQAAHLDERLRQCESELAGANARIAALEKAEAAPSSSLEDLLREGTPLHDSFAALIASSVAQALKTMPAESMSAALEERLQNVSLMGKSVSARMDALESRLDTLEPRFNQQVEKAAASAAARILREEIARLIQG